MYKRYNNQEDKVDHVKELTDKLEAGVKDIFNNPNYDNGFDEENFKRYLEAVSKFHNYSYRNCMLIQMQNPEASLVAGYKAWEKEHERHVKKGEHGIKILAPCPYKKMVEKNKLDPETNLPMRDENGDYIKEKSLETFQSYRQVTVFDVSQTEGKELARILSHFTREIGGDVENFEKMMKALEEVSPVKIEHAPIYTGAHGYFYSSSDGSKIVVNEGMSQVQDIKTAIHELAHAVLHDPTTGMEKDSELSRNAKEVQAESVAYVVCQHFGIDTGDYSFSYVGNWSTGKDLKELTASMDLIQKTASGLITSIEEKIQEIELAMEKPEKEAELEKIKEIPEQEFTRIELTKEPEHQRTIELSR